MQPRGTGPAVDPSRLHVSALITRDSGVGAALRWRALDGNRAGDGGTVSRPAPTVRRCAASSCDDVGCLAASRTALKNVKNATTCKELVQRQSLPSNAIWSRTMPLSACPGQ